MTQGHEQWGGDCMRERGCWVEGGKWEKIGITIIIYSIKYNLKIKSSSKLKVKNKSFWEGPVKG